MMKPMWCCGPPSIGTRTLQRDHALGSPHRRRFITIIRGANQKVVVFLVLPSRLIVLCQRMANATINTQVPTLTPTNRGIRWCAGRSQATNRLVYDVVAPVGVERVYRS